MPSTCCSAYVLEMMNSRNTGSGVSQQSDRFREAAAFYAAFTGEPVTVLLFCAQLENAMECTSQALPNRHSCSEKISPET